MRQHPLLFILMLGLSAQATTMAVAQASDSLVKRNYQGADVPDGVALRWLSKLAADKPVYAAALILNQTAEDTNSADRIVSFLAELHRDLLSERRDAEIKVACDADSALLTKDEAFRLLDSIDSVRAAVDAKYVVIAEARVGATTLRPVLDELKAGIVVQKISARDAHRGAPSTAVISNLAAFCATRREQK